jgi:hypothetical protein
MRVVLGVVLAALFACGADSPPSSAPSRQRWVRSQDPDGLAILHAIATRELDGASIERMGRLNASPLTPVLCLLDVLPPGLTGCRVQIGGEG